MTRQLSWAFDAIRASGSISPHFYVTEAASILRAMVDRTRLNNRPLELHLRFLTWLTGAHRARRYIRSMAARRRGESVRGKEMSPISS